MNINDLSDNQGARRPRKRVGRGPGSGLGKTGGRGVKGQKSRSGVAIKGFEGGQMPLYMRLPKRGFKKPNRVKFQELTLGRLQEAIDAGKINAGALTEEALVASGVVRRKLDGVRLIASGKITAKVSLEIACASAGAISAVEKAGGSVSVSIPPKVKTPRNIKTVPADPGDSK
ncbi:MAG: 50S ribosomal protein L15 [Alphaproteobacteria bacterium]|jgi:large subunit ribosomal protein L15|nr:50S ribosomal protein L15 [Alphaproteobacteria bacterium]